MTDDRAPRLDPRDTATVVAQTEALLTALTRGAWTPAGPADEQDPLGALVRVFADMAGQVIDGVNAVPDAGFAAFLTLTGALAQRPAPARVPLTFRLTDGAPIDAAVPAGTKVGATAADDDTSPDPIVFETDAELVVTRSSLLAAYAHDPGLDRLDADPRPVLASATDALSAFAARTPGVHELLLACPALLARPGAKTWTVTLEFAGPPPDVAIAWLGHDGVDWRPLTADTKRNANVLTATLTAPPPLRLQTLAGREDAWLCARLVGAPSAPPSFPALKKVSLAAEYGADNLAAKRLLRGASELETTVDYYPFDTAPTVGAALALDGGDALAQPPGTSVSLTFTLSPGTANTDLRIVWELLDPTGAWLELGRSSGASPAILGGSQNPYQFVDDTYALTRAGRVRFVLPYTPGDQKLSGKSGRWLRARVLQGSYQAQKAPLVNTLALAYNHSLSAVPAAMCVARDLGFERALGPVAANATAAIFTRTPPGAPALGDRPALYLCFDRAFEPRPVQLWFTVPPPDPAQIAPPDQLPPLGDEPRLAWEYLGPSGWTRLGVRDDTHGLRQRGLLVFVAPTDLTPASLFDRTGVWLRLRWLGGSFRVPPRVAAVIPNTTWASHAAARRGEVLGSGSGAPGQTFTLVAAPVLAGERVEVREQPTTSEQQFDELRETLGEDAVTAERDDAGALQSVWIRWTPVAHFRGSGPADRHYVLDPDRGELRFGDGLAGRAPPQGRSNLRATYATGGGTRGNRPAGAVAELKAAIAFVADVTNHEPASGGTGREDAARTRARGPRRLRHRGRAVTVADLEDLAFEAAPEVARAHALTAPFNPIDVGVDLTDVTRDARGWAVLAAVPDDTAAVSQRVAEVRLVLVPRDTADQPAPSVGLIEHVEAYLQSRAPAAMRVHVSGPRWIRVAIAASFLADQAAAADRLIGDLRAAITRFLHPLTGGELGQGWDFGRIPRRSHLYRLIARFPGVRRIDTLQLITDPPLPDASEPLTEQQRRALAGALVYSGAHALTLLGHAEEP